MISDADISDLGQFIIENLGTELIKQNHRATGKLIESLDYNVQYGGAFITLNITMNDYGRWVNTGRRAGAKKIPVQVLVEWIKEKGIATNNKKILGIAFAIQNKIHKEGSPTKNRVSRFGKGVEFVDDTLIRIEAEIEKRITDAAAKTIEVEIDNLVKRI